MDRAVQTSPARCAATVRRVGNDWVVMMGGRRFALELTPIEGGCDIRHEGETYRLLSDWKLGDPIFRGTMNGRRSACRSSARHGGTACSTGARRSTSPC